jgi:hypothetical protein
MAKHHERSADAPEQKANYGKNEGQHLLWQLTIGSA